MRINTDLKKNNSACYISTTSKIQIKMNHTINFENKNSNINKKSEYFTKKTDYQTFNTSKNIIKKKKKMKILLIKMMKFGRMMIKVTKIMPS